MSNNRNDNSIIIHQVIWQYTPNITSKTKANIEKKLINFSKIKKMGILINYISLHDSPENTNNEFTHILTMVFLNKKYRDYYLNSSKHKNFLVWLDTQKAIQKYMTIDHKLPTQLEKYLM